MSLKKPYVKHTSFKSVGNRFPSLKWPITWRVGFKPY